MMGDNMLKRKISEYLMKWHQKEKKKSLIVEGPRQVGKTHIIEDFIINHYDDKHYFYVDFKDNFRLSRMFKREISISRIYQEIQLHSPDKLLVQGEAIIYFDNIQLCPEVIPYLKVFTEDGLYDVIASGSSLSVIYKRISSFPIGFVDRYKLDSLDFEEYLWANGYDSEQIELFKELHHKNELKVSSIHEVLIDLFREYIAIGGMPEVVSEYLKQNNFKLAFDIQKKIIELYYAEMEIHSKQSLRTKLVDCFNSVPEQLTKANRKFQYRLVSEKGRATMYKSSVDWLLASGMLIKSVNLSKPIRPLNENAKKDTFKLYLHDPGLLVSMYGDNTQLEILKGNLHVKNGAVLENAVASLLYRNRFKLYYYEKNSTLDIDFVVSVNLKITPLLLKDADNTKSKALRSLESKYGIYNGLRLSSLTSFEESNRSIIPVYMTIALET